MVKKNFAAYASITAAFVIFGFSFLFTKRVLAYLEIFQLLGIRFLLAAVVHVYLGNYGCCEGAF